MKVALIHDHLAQDGGAEATLRVICEIWPEAPIFTLVYDKKRAHKFFLNKDIRTSFIQKIPLGLKKYQWFFPLMPQAVESYDLSDFDLIISSSSSFAKGVITKPEAIHICYCHTPTRFLWSDTHSYIRELNANFIVKKIAALFLTGVRNWDKIAGERVDYFVANSRVVSGRIKKYYNRDSVVIYPPVDLKKYKIGPVGDYFLAGGRIVPYKRFDLIVKAFNQLGRKIKIFGDGPDLEKLKKMAKPNVELLGRVSSEDKIKLYSSALAFINPQEEDFGITMVESMASGRPVIAYRKGGAGEIVNFETGVLFDEQSWEDISNAVLRFKPENFDSQKIRDYAKKFDAERYKAELKNFVDITVKNHKN